MTDKFELDKKFQALPEHAQVFASEALRNVLSSQGVDADASYYENIGRNIKQAFIALFEGESSQGKLGVLTECEGYWLCQGEGLEGTGATPIEAHNSYLFRNGRGQ